MENELKPYCNDCEKTKDEADHSACKKLTFQEFIEKIITRSNAETPNT